MLCPKVGVNPIVYPMTFFNKDQGHSYINQWSRNKMGGTHLIRESRTDGRTLFGESSVSLDPTEPADNVGAGVRVVVVWLGLSVAQVA